MRTLLAASTLGALGLLAASGSGGPGGGNSSGSVGAEVAKPGVGQVTYLKDDAGWTNDVRNLNGARFLQLRFSFINNIQTGLNAELSALGVAFQEN